MGHNWTRKELMVVAIATYRPRLARVDMAIWNNLMWNVNIIIF